MVRNWVKLTSQSLICIYALLSLIACTSPNEAAVQAILESESLKKENKFSYDEPTNQCVNQDGRIGINIGSPGECVDSSGKDLQSSQLNAAILRGANFEFANLKNANLSNADLTGANFENADLSGANLTGAITKNTNFKNASGLNQDSIPVSNSLTPVPAETAINVVPPAAIAITETIINNDSIVNQPTLIEYIDSTEKVDQVLEIVEESLEIKVVEKEKVIEQLKEQLQNIAIEQNQEQVDANIETPSLNNSNVNSGPSESIAPPQESIQQSELTQKDSALLQDSSQPSDLPSQDLPPIEQNSSNDVLPSPTSEVTTTNPTSDLLPETTNAVTTEPIVDEVAELKKKIAKEMQTKHQLKEQIEKVKEIKNSDPAEKQELAQELKEAAKSKK